MKTHLLRGAIGALIVLTFLPARAAYNPALVSADARWVVHMDLNALRASTLGRELVTAIEKAQTQNTGGIIGIDVPKVLTTIGSVTAYGTNLSKDPDAIDGALIAQGTEDLRKIGESVLLQLMIAHPKKVTEVSDLPFPAYAVTDENAPEGKRMQLFVAFPPEPIVLVSRSKAQLLKARDVFRGNAPSLAKSGDPAFARLAAKVEGAYILAASVVPTNTIFPENAPQARVLQLANSGALAFGERGANTFLRAELLASSDQNAEKLMKILQGMTAMLSLAESNDRQLGEFLKSTSVARESERVTLQLAYPSERLVQMTQSLRSHMDDRPAHRQPPLINGRAIAEWTAADADAGASAPEGAAPSALAWRTIENVKLVNGTLITLGRWLNGGKNARFDRVEITPAGGAGMPLVFRHEMMRNVRGTMTQFAFPGADGVYTLKVAYTNDPEGKAKFAVSVRDPNEGEQSKAPPAGR